MKRLGIIIYGEWFESLHRLKPEDGWEIMLALMDYRRDGTVTELENPSNDAIFLRLKADLDADEANYLEKCEKNRQNGAQGGRPRKADGFSEKRTVSEESERFQKNPKEKKRKEKNINIYESERETPALEDIKLYFQKMQFKSDPEMFEAHYASRGWKDKDGTDLAANWDALAKKWELREQRFGDEKRKKEGDVYELEFSW